MRTDLHASVPLFATCVLAVILSATAEDKNGSEGGKPRSNPKDDNYIITHYGKEYYTPVRSTEFQMREGGFFTAEVIPVDVKTGQELKSVKNVFVPMRTGYTVHGDTAVIPVSAGMVLDPKSVTPDSSSGASILGPRPSSTSNTIENGDGDFENKRKLPKKFKNEFGSNSKKSAQTTGNAVLATTGSDWSPESGRRVKTTPKRHVDVISQIGSEWQPSWPFIDERHLRNQNWNRRASFYQWPSR